METLIAITRDVSPAIGRCELVHLPRTDIDLDRARRQHRAYEQALATLGCQVVSLPADPALPDSVFVEDVAVVLDEVAVITRPGAHSRRLETAAIAHELKAHRPLVFVEPPGTLDGGDVLHIGRRLYVGLSGRSNLAGIDQLRRAVSPHGYVTTPVAVTGCLHLKSAVTRVGSDTLLVNPRWVERAAFEPAAFIDVDPDEPYAANGLLVGTTVIFPCAFARTRRRLEARRVSVLAVDVSELQKAEGGVTCCSLIFPAAKTLRT